MSEADASGGSTADEVEGILAAVLAGDPVDAVVDRVVAAAAADQPGYRIVVAARSGPARVHGRSLDLPRRVVLALDRVTTGAPARPDGSPGTPVTGVVEADLDVAPWADAAADLENAGLGAPVLLPLVEREAVLGVLAAFPPRGSGAALPEEVGRSLERWATVAALALARAADRQRLRRSALHDDATGLPNQSTVMARLREALHRRPRRPMALVQLTVDRLDALEDGLVGAQGDALLRAVGERLRAVIRPEDLVGHLRGSSFAVICDDVGPHEATEVGERVRQALAQPVSVGDHDIAITPGVGVVVATELDTVNGLIHKAGIAARESAAAGGVEVVRYRPGTYEAAVARIDLERDLRRALSGEGLWLAYQPQVSLHPVPGRLVGAEALVRWDSPRGSIGPEEFIPVAEESGLVVDLGGWALDTAAAALAGPIDAVGVSVNVSARQLDDPELLARVDAAVQRHGIDPSRLCLEITESALVRDVDRSASLLRRLHGRGVRISIDDFGTGYASLEHLRQVEVADTLKIDRIFVGGIVHDARDRAIVAAAVTLGRTLGFTVVAEGVEDVEQARILAEMGCDAAQGYLYGEAVAAEELAIWRPPTPDLEL